MEASGWVNRKVSSLGSTEIACAREGQKLSAFGASATEQKRWFLSHALNFEARACRPEEGAVPRNTESCHCHNPTTLALLIII